MGMFGDLDNLSKKQQEASARNQAPASVNVSQQSSSPSHPALATSPTVTPKTIKPTAHQPKKQSVPKTQGLDGAVGYKPVSDSTLLNKSAFERTNERTKIRHSFDIFQDQLFELRDLAYERQRGSVKKVPLGDLVQEAIDLYLAAQHNSK